MTVGEVWKYLDSIAPKRYAESFDNVGLLIGDENSEVTGVCCCLDITHSIIKEAAEKDANLIVSHHPVIFDALKSIPMWSPVAALMRQDIAVIAMHTNFDIAEGGVNDTLVELLEWESGGVLEVTQSDGKGFGAVCDIPLEFTPQMLAEYCKEKLDLGGVRFSRINRTIKRIAVCCGGGVDRTVMQLAREQSCDAIISGDIKHNFWIESENCGLTLIDAGHFGTEKAAAHKLAKLVTAEFSSVPVFSAECECDPCGYV
ncbi:MAG: Nif3-like dinuclear metal center hexameric protein [Ruminococcaceae bacterium]|nr:Nif3-like dinuclear metal center hexameric protein [Oscillospiraceae bacterium]